MKGIAGGKNFEERGLEEEGILLEGQERQDRLDRASQTCPRPMNVASRM